MDMFWSSRVRLTEKSRSLSEYELLNKNRFLTVVLYKIITVYMQVVKMKQTHLPKCMESKWYECVNFSYLTRKHVQFL